MERRQHALLLQLSSFSSPGKVLRKLARMLLMDGTYNLGHD